MIRNTMATIVLLIACGAAWAEAPAAATAAASPAMTSTPTAAAAELDQLRQETADQKQKIADQQRRLDSLEAKVGLPSSLRGWIWFGIGLIGEGVFFLRFVVQWWATERQGRTVVPMAFWHLSLIGTALVLAYAIFVINWVFMLAYSLNIFLYVRNLAIAKRSPQLAPVEEKVSE